MIRPTTGEPDRSPRHVSDRPYRRSQTQSPNDRPPDKPVDARAVYVGVVTFQEVRFPARMRQAFLLWRAVLRRRRRTGNGGRLTPPPPRGKGGALPSTFTAPLEGGAPSPPQHADTIRLTPPPPRRQGRSLALQGSCVPGYRSCLGVKEWKRFATCAGGSARGNSTTQRLPGSSIGLTPFRQAQGPEFIEGQRSKDSKTHNRRRRPLTSAFK